MKTEALIALLSHQLPPVRRLRSPAQRTRRFAIATISGLLVLVAVRQAFGSVHSDWNPALTITLVTAGFASLLAAYAAFLVATPDRVTPPAWILVLVLGLWLVPLTPKGLQHWADAGLLLRALAPSMDCVIAASLISIPLLILFAVEMSGSACRNPARAGALAGIAVAAATWIGIRILIPHPAAMVLDLLAEQFGTAIILAIVSTIIGSVVVGRIAPRGDFG